MPRQIITIRLEGLTAGDYLTHLSDPEPAANGLLAVELRAEPLGDVVEATLAWAGAVPEACEAAKAAGLPRVAEAVALESVVVPDPPVEQERAPAPRPVPAPARRLSGLPARVAERFAATAHAPHVSPLVLRWA